MIKKKSKTLKRKTVPVKPKYNPQWIVKQYDPQTGDTVEYPNRYWVIKRKPIDASKQRIWSRF